VRRLGVFHPKLYSALAPVAEGAMDAMVLIYRNTDAGSFDFLGTGQQTGATKVMWTAEPIPARIAKILRPKQGVGSHDTYENQSIRVQVSLQTQPPAGEEWQAGLAVEVASCGEDTAMIGRVWFVKEWESSSNPIVRTLLCNSNAKQG
jgi:hypothetical protein